MQQRYNRRWGSKIIIIIIKRSGEKKRKNGAKVTKSHLLGRIKTDTPCKTHSHTLTQAHTRSKRKEEEEEEEEKGKEEGLDIFFSNCGAVSAKLLGCFKAKLAC